MINELDSKFKTVEFAKKKALIAYMAAGDPVFSQQEKLVEALSNSGVDILELGVPFSDPIADGPTIQAAAQRALNNGVTLKAILKWVPKLKKKTDIPIVLMTYLNPLHAYGMAKFAQDAGRAGVSGVIIPDLIPEEGKEWERALSKNNVHLIYLLAPTSPAARQKMIAQKTRGFLYAVSVAGVTGARRSISPKTKKWLAHLRGLGPRPVCVGFGISEPGHIKSLRGAVDGFIVGSALIDRIHKSPASTRVKVVSNFIRSLAKECSYGR